MLDTLRGIFFGRLRILPEWLYKWLPIICMFWASVIWVVPMAWYAVLCSVALYAYAGWLVYVRYIE